MQIPPVIGVALNAPVKRLSLREMEEWKAKARALDEALEYLKICPMSEEALTVTRILRSWDRR